MKLAKEFVKFTVKELGLKSLPKSIKFEGDNYSAQYLTFGTYNPSTDEVVVVKGQRHPVDVLRTLAHELVHHKQREDGQELNGEDGSNIENEANAKAGELMRKFRTVRPEIFNVGPWGFHTNMENNKIEKILHVAKTGEPEKIDEQYVDGFTAKLLVTVAHKLSPENRKKFYNESIGDMVTLAYKLVTR
jgi:hypothetical protein